MRKPAPALEPAIAALRYVAGGCDTVHGMPTTAQLRALLALRPGDRLAWGRAVVAAFAAEIPTTDEHRRIGTTTLDELEHVSPLAEDYLFHLSRGYPRIGSWRWAARDVPQLPTIVTVARERADADAPWIAVIAMARGYVAHARGDTRQAARIAARDWMRAQEIPPV